MLISSWNMNRWDHSKCSFMRDWLQQPRGSGSCPVTSSYSLLVLHHSSPPLLLRQKLCTLSHSPVYSLALQRLISQTHLKRWWITAQRQKLWAGPGAWQALVWKSFTTKVSVLGRLLPSQVYDSIKPDLIAERSPTPCPACQPYFLQALC